jgi:hypothetical protein
MPRGKRGVHELIIIAAARCRLGRIPDLRRDLLG